MKRSLSVLSFFVLQFGLFFLTIGGDVAKVPTIKPDNVDTERVGQIVDFISALQEKDDIIAAKLLMKALRNDSLGELPLVVLFQKLKDPKVAQACRPELQQLASENPSALKLNLAALISSSDTDPKIRTNLALTALATVKSFGDLDAQTLLAALRITAITGQLLAVQDRFDEGDQLFQKVIKTNVQFSNNFEFVESAALFYRSMEVSDSVPLSQRENASVEKNLLIKIILEKFNQPRDANDAQRLVGFYERLGEYDLAISAIQTQLVKTPKNQAFWGMLGAFYTRVGKNDEALEIRRSLALQLPKNQWVQLQYAESLIFTNKFATAIPILRNFLLLQQNNQYAKMLLGTAYYETGNYQQALEYLAGIDDFIAFRLRVSALNYLQQYGRAIELLEGSVQKYADKIGFPFYFMFLDVGEKSGNPKLVKKYAEVIKQKFGWDNPQIANAVGYTYAALNIDLEIAEELIVHALKANPDSVEIIDSMAWLFYRKKDFKNARVYIDQALSKSPENINSVIADHAGDIYWQLRRYLSAVKYWKKSLEKSGEDIDRERVKKKIRAANELIIFED